MKKLIVLFIALSTCKIIAMSNPENPQMGKVPQIIRQPSSIPAHAIPVPEEWPENGMRSFWRNCMAWFTSFFQAPQPNPHISRQLIWITKNDDGTTKITHLE